MRPAAVIVLAAGEGTRMKSRLSKMLHPIGGRSLVGHVVRNSRELDPRHLVVVASDNGVPEHLAESDPDVGIVVQPAREESGRYGTAYATRLALETIPADLTGTVVVTTGDTPLLSGATLRDLVARHESAGAKATVLTAVVPDPNGYGRVVRRGDGSVDRIVEHKEATDAEQAIAEINSGIFAFEAGALRTALGQVKADNSAGEEYLPDVLAILRADGEPVDAVTTGDHREILGVNNRVQLAELGRILNDRILERWMLAGVTVVDPLSTWIEDTVTLGSDVTLHPNTQLRGSTRVQEGAEVGPDTTLTGCTVGESARVVRTHGESAEVGPRATVGPYAYLRPGTVLGAGGKIGTFVEVKASEIGEGAKVPHLSYVGNAVIGEGTNIGAASVFVNYDGENKHQTTIGRHCRTGSDNMFVAPVTVGDGAYTGAGTVVRKDVPPGALAVNVAPQRNLEGWTERKRPGTAPAEAARLALAGEVSARGEGVPEKDGPDHGESNS